MARSKSEITEEADAQPEGAKATPAAFTATKHLRVEVRHGEVRSSEASLKDGLTERIRSISAEFEELADRRLANVKRPGSNLQFIKFAQKRYLSELEHARSECLRTLEEHYENHPLAESDYSNVENYIQLEYDDAVERVSNYAARSGDSIQSKPPVDPSKLSRSEKNKLLDKFAAENPGKPISAYAALLFPENEIEAAPREAPLPASAPALWATDKQPSDTPPDFIKRHYEPWLGKGFARPNIKQLDPQLYTALNNWLRNNEMPADLDLPTLKEKNDRWVSRIAAEGRPDMGALPAREASNLRQIIGRRKGGRE